MKIHFEEIPIFLFTDWDLNFKQSFLFVLQRIENMIKKFNTSTLQCISNEKFSETISFMKYFHSSIQKKYF